jgi:crotonobetainyl-CoA:carnitine CoA-transferase CaiB-like acyl-CoA transferase
MLSTVAHALSETMQRYAGMPPAPTPDAELYGFGALYRLYACTEGSWVFLAAPSEREWRRLAATPSFAALARDRRFADAEARRSNDRALATALAEVFAQRGAADWESELTAADVACVVSGAGPVEAAVTDPDSLARQLGWVVEVEHHTLEHHPRMVAPWKFSRSQTLAGKAPRIGEHTDGVLRELGLSDARIAELRARRAIGEPH